MKSKQAGFGFFGFLAVLAVVVGLVVIFGPVTETTCVPPSKEEVAHADWINDTFSSAVGTKATAKEKCTTKVVR